MPYHREQVCAVNRKGFFDVLPKHVCKVDLSSSGRSERFLMLLFKMIPCVTVQILRTRVRHLRSFSAICYAQPVPYSLLCITCILLMSFTVIMYRLAVFLHTYFGQVRGPRPLPPWTYCPRPNWASTMYVYKQKVYINYGGKKYCAP